MIKVTRFGENLNDDYKWYQTAGGIFPCDEDTIAKLWDEWAVAKWTRRKHTEKENVFIFQKPLRNRWGT